MARSGESYRQAPGADPAHARLGPSKAHDLIRQRLERVAGRWGLKPADIHRLARQTRSHSYAPGEIIVPRGARAGCLGLVVQGQVAVYGGQHGSVRPVAVLTPGSTFGEMMLADGRASNATLQALTPCEAWFLRRADLLALRAERRTERQVTLLWQLVRAGGLLLAAILVIVLAVSLPSSRRALALVPMGVGQWCSDRGRDACTHQAWQVAANLAPDDPNPYLALGGFYYKQGNVAAAEQLFESARTLASDSPEAHNNLGIIYAQQGQHDRAIAAFRRALELQPGVPAVEHNLGLSLQATHDCEGAVTHYQAALALGEPQAGTLLNMAIALFETGQIEKAEDAAREALRLDPDLAPAYALLGAVALELRQPDKAVADLQRAVALDASYGQAHFYLGLAYRSLGQPAQAIAAFNEALAHANDEGMRMQIWRHLGELYEMQR